MAIILAILAAIPAAAAPLKPQRIVSINLCTDYLALRLADRARIKSLTFLSRDPSLSLIADEIDGIPLNYGQAEEVRLYEPDLILAGTYGGRFATEFMKSLGYPVVEVPPTAALDEIAPVVRIVGAALGEEERAEAMASAVEERLAALRRSLPPHLPSAVLFQARGFVAGAPSLSHDILTLAGLSNRAAEAGLGDWASIGVEGLIRLAPEIVILDEDVRQGRSLAHELLSGRAMREFLRARRVLRLGTAFAACGVPETLDAIDLLKERASPAAIARAQ